MFAVTVIKTKLPSVLMFSTVIQSTLVNCELMDAVEYPVYQNGVTHSQVCPRNSLDPLNLEVYLGSL